MKIIDKRNKETAFEDIKIGTCFISFSADKKNNIFMKTEDSYCENNNYENAVNLNNGALEYFGDCSMVLPVDCELIIKG